MERRHYRPYLPQRGARDLLPELEIAGVVSRVLVDQIRTVDIRYVHGEPMHYLDRDELAEVERATTCYFGL